MNEWNLECGFRHPGRNSNWRDRPCEEERYWYFYWSKHTLTFKRHECWHQAANKKCKTIKCVILPWRLTALACFISGALQTGSGRHFTTSNFRDWPLWARRDIFLPSRCDSYDNFNVGKLCIPGPRISTAGIGNRIVNVRRERTKRRTDTGRKRMRVWESEREEESDASYFTPTFDGYRRGLRATWSTSRIRGVRRKSKSVRAGEEEETHHLGLRDTKQPRDSS